MAGKSTEIGELPPIECTYVDCRRRFHTIQEMKYHKRYEPAHNYCKKCDVDCDSWEELTLHKVSAMAPWLEGKYNPDESPKHITCEFCGEDFKSFGGRKRHREHEHPADQDIECPGCNVNFTRASQLVAHYEQGQCGRITRREFEGNRQQKQIMAEVMKNPDYVQTRLNKFEPDYSEQDAEEGGVSILDQDDAEQKSGYEPLKAQVLGRSGHETWPRLPGQPSSHFTESLRSLSIDSATSALMDDDDTASQATTLAPSLVNLPVPWGGNTSQTLFKDAKPTPPAGDWAAILKQREEEALADQTTNMFHSRFWDPTSSDWDIQRFLDMATGKYCCIFEGCEYIEYEMPEQLEHHMKDEHMKTQYRCPCCLKIFKSASGLISHAESSSAKCKIRNSKVFPKLMDELSGGFLKTRQLRQPKIYAVDKAMVKAGEKPVNGVMTTKFTAKMPDQKYGVS